MSSLLLLESATLNCTDSPARSTTISSQAYVLSLAALPEHYAASASAPSNTIDLFDKSTLQGLQTFPGHEVATTYMLATDSLAGTGRSCLVSSGKDGTIKAWDERSNSVSVKMTPSRRMALLCCDVSPDGFTVAAGSDLQGDDASIVYWDPRHPVAPLRTHASTHSDDITVLQFWTGSQLSLPRNLLLSASSDGLISTSNADEEDEDEAVLHVGNWGCSISQAGWIHGSSAPNIWASSDMETFSTWSNELDLVKSLDIRGPSVHTQQRSWVTDYVVAGHSSRLMSGPNLGIFVGSNEGDIGLISNPGLLGSDVPWCLHSLWTGSHTGIVRSLLWDESNGLLLTGGEDSKINLWSNASRPVDFYPSLATESNHDLMDVDSPRKRDIDWQGVDREMQEGKRARRI